jgi:hypothetical protein
MAGTDHATILGALLAIEIWHRLFIDQAPPAIPAREIRTAARTEVGP